MGKKGILAGLGKRVRRSRNRHVQETSKNFLASTTKHNSGPVPIEIPELDGSGGGLEYTMMYEVATLEGESNSHLSSIEEDNWQAEMVDSAEQQFADEEEGNESTEEKERQLFPARAAEALASPGSPGRRAVESGDEAICSESGGILLDNWRAIWAVILSTGSRKLTKNQYQSVRNLAYGFAAINTKSWKVESSVFNLVGENFEKLFSVLPHYSTLQKKHKPIVLDLLSSRAIEHEELVDESKGGARSERGAGNGDAKVRVRTILPSEYARADMACPHVWSEMRSTSLLSTSHLYGKRSSVLSSDCVDVIPIVCARTWFYGPQNAMSVDSNSQRADISGSDFAESGDIVSIELLCNRSLDEAVQRCFGVCQTSYLFTTLQGVFAHSWTVHSSRREMDADFTEEYTYEVSPRDSEIAKSLKFVNYQSPTDSVSVSIPPPPIPFGNGLENSGNGRGGAEAQEEVAESLRRRREALRERTRQMDAAWTRWEKPILKPGDFVVLLRPCTREERVGSQLYLNGSTTLLTAVYKASRVCLVHRFWAERQERSRHVFFLNGGTDFGSDNDLSLHKFCGAFVREPDREYAYVRSVQLERKHAGHRGPQKSVPVSSIGILDNGELYFIYRILLFWDGFDIQSGNSASGEGLYMLCLNLPLKARISANAVRILNLTPPGVKSTTVLNRILQDVVEGATDGFVDYDAYGTKRRICIDLIGALGDTPALNGALDVLGHTATACCHLCRFIRLGRTSVGSKYGNSVGNGAQSAFKRGYWQHAAIHDCGAQRETCRLMGVKQEANVATLPLHTFREALYRGKDRIRTVNNGQSVLPYHFDPYKASFIAPDHLLSGHLRDCITLALKLLPSSQHIETCERMIMDLLATVDLPRQNRLIDHAKKGLYTMSMTEVFAVGIVAEHGFLRGCAMLDEPLSASCKSSIDLVGSCARLITDIYHRPELKRDGKMAVKRFEDNDGASNIRKIQRQVQEHIQKVENLCCMNDDDKDALDEGRGSRERKSELTKIYRTAMTAIRALDKPNLHRLSEMVHTTLPMVGHMSLIGELVLEKAHQRLKRALKQSNNKQVQLQAMKSVSFDDWQGRLSLISANCFRQNDEALLSCYRLLAGRESVRAMKGQLSEKSKLEVMRALGPEICIAAELHTQGKSVLSPRADALEEGHWTLKGPACRIFFSSRPAQNALDNYVRMAFENYFNECSIFTADSISSKSSTGKPVTCFRRNDVIETLCCLPNEPKFHFLFLLQTNCSDRYSSLEKSSASSLWCILNFLQITTTDGKQLPGLPQFFVSVQPCIADEDLSSEMDDEYLKERLYRFKRYKVDSAAQISFAEIDTSMGKVGIIRAPVSSRDISQVTASSGDSFFALTRDTGYPTRKG